MTMTSLLWRHLYLELSRSVQYFAQQFSFTTRHVLKSIVSYETSSSAVAERSRDASCLSVVSFNSTKRWVEYFGSVAEGGLDVT